MGVEIKYTESRMEWRDWKYMYRVEWRHRRLVLYKIGNSVVQI